MYKPVTVVRAFEPAGESNLLTLLKIGKQQCERSFEPAGESNILTYVLLYLKQEQIFVIL